MDSSEQILRSVKSILQLFGPVLIESCIFFRDERFMTEFSTIIDCTVIQRKRPELSHKEALPWFSGKHYMYCLKKQVIVDIVSGKACFISKGHPGSHHDMKILKETVDEVKEMIDNSKILADKGYKGATDIIPNIVIPTDSTTDSELRRRRVRVERYFGRLKGKFDVLANKFPLGDEWFDLVFDTCASILNVELTRHSLKEGDEDKERNILENIKNKEIERREKVKAKNKKYRENKKKLLEESE